MKYKTQPFQASRKNRVGNAHSFKHIDRKYVHSLKAQLQEVKGVKEGEFIPCLFMKGGSDQLLLHFHANGEDVG